MDAVGYPVTVALRPARPPRMLLAPAEISMAEKLWSMRAKFTPATPPSALFEPVAETSPKEATSEIEAEHSRRRCRRRRCCCSP